MPIHLSLWHPYKTLGSPSPSPSSPSPAEPAAVPPPLPPPGLRLSECPPGFCENRNQCFLTDDFLKSVTLCSELGICLLISVNNIHEEGSPRKE